MIRQPSTKKSSFSLIKHDLVEPLLNTLGLNCFKFDDPSTKLQGLEVIAPNYFFVRYI